MNEDPIHIISLGAGVQSSAMALMAARGEITPMPKCAVFADTQAEPASVYKWLDWLEMELPFPVFRVSAGNLTDESLRVRKIQKPDAKLPIGTPYIKKIIPVFGELDGKVTAALGRQCTFDYKIRPVMRQLRKIAKIRAGQKEVGVIQWIGISMDEAIRMKDSREPWAQHRWPLIEQRISRQDCLQWMQDNGYPEPPRSACVYCPFHSDKEWSRLKKYEPQEFQKAVEFDRELRRRFREEDRGMNMTVYLHQSCKPLGEVDFQKGPCPEFDFVNECEGMCGV